jgi:hypothetical protein
MRPLLLITLLIGIGSLHAQIWPKRTIPLNLAEPAAKEAMVAFPDNKSNRQLFMYAFCQAFLDQWRWGSRSGTITRQHDKSPYSQGYDAGMRALAGDLKESSISPEDFGYVLKTIEGTYKGGFESSEFKVEGSGERFYTNFGNISDLPEGKVRINVWMSPETELGFGHMNQWKREIIINEIENK